MKIFFDPKINIEQSIKQSNQYFNAPPLPPFISQLMEMNVFIFKYTLLEVLILNKSPFHICWKKYKNGFERTLCKPVYRFCSCVQRILYGFHLSGYNI